MLLKNISLFGGLIFTHITCMELLVNNNTYKMSQNNTGAPELRYILYDIKIF